MADKPAAAPVAEAKEAPAATPPAPAQPAKLVVTAARYGFYDEHNRYRGWRAGDVITDPTEIALLVARNEVGKSVKAA